jgi:hypothetical protein
LKLSDFDYVNFGIKSSGLKMIYRAFYKLSRLSYIISFGFMDLQLWFKYLAAIQIVVVLYCAWVCVSLSNVALVNCLGARSLTEEDHLYIRLCILGKYFSTGGEICTFC